MEKSKALSGAALPSCMQCRFSDTATDLVSGQSTLICRFKPPQVFAAAGAVPGGQVQWMTAVMWPNVKSSDWCGEHKPRMNA